LTHRVLVIFGTRPEAIKVAAVVRALADHPDLEPVVAVTAQHRSMLDQVLELFDIRPDHDLDIMMEGQSLADITSRALTGLVPLIERAQPSAVLVQGDTSTTFAGALASFYTKTAVAHLEAGYRTNDTYQPFPEEMNRRLVSELAGIHFAVNEGCRDNLLREGHSASDIHVIGNTGIDALMLTADMNRKPSDLTVARALETERRVVLMTMHRRENWGGPIEQACLAARRIAESRPDVEIVFATHLNPVVQDAARSVLGDVERVSLVSALDYASFVALLRRADLVMSDSGGIHEESLALRKPLLLLREVSEWPEAVASGAVELVGSDAERIVTRAIAKLEAIAEGRELPTFVNRLADGRASRRLADALAVWLESGSAR